MSPAVAWQGGLTGRLRIGASRLFAEPSAVAALLADRPLLPPRINALAAAHALPLACIGADAGPSDTLEPLLDTAITTLCAAQPGNAHLLNALRRMRDCFDLHCHLLQALEMRARLLMEVERIGREAHARDRSIAGCIDRLAEHRAGPVFELGRSTADDAPGMIERIRSGGCSAVAIRCWWCARNGDATVPAPGHAAAIAARPTGAAVLLVAPPSALHPGTDRGEDIPLLPDSELLPAELISALVTGSRAIAPGCPTALDAVARSEICGLSSAL
ncbi:MAG: hypothetical protein ACOCZK_04930 [Planctomycetota bacterium]